MAGLFCWRVSPPWLDGNPILGFEHFPPDCDRQKPPFCVFRRLHFHHNPQCRSPRCHNALFLAAQKSVFSALGGRCFAMASKVRRRRHGHAVFDGKGLRAIRLAFAHKFGRLPRGDDPVFFGPDADRPYSLPSGGTQRLLLEAMLENGTAPQIVYAFCRTGFAVSDKNRTAAGSAFQVGHGNQRIFGIRGQGEIYSALNGRSASPSHFRRICSG